ncbi:MAG: glycosyltransferase family 39 protein [Flavobacteriales bacterium]|nr:glycosyltransferase family 39 protein [Flavobacteriales bacterium]
MHHIDALELWHDEANSMFEANGLNYVGNAPEQGFTKADLPAFNTAANAIRACVFIDSGNGSLYVLLLHCWSLLFGNTPLALRSLSVLFALLAIFMTHRLSRELFRDDLAALISAALMTASPIYIGQSQQVRSYMLALFLSLWATTLLFRMLRSERPGTWTILAYAALVLASMLSHYSTCYVFLVHPIIALILGTPLKSILRILSGGLLALVLFMVWMAAAGVKDWSRCGCTTSTTWTK